MLTMNEATKKLDELAGDIRPDPQLLWYQSKLVSLQIYLQRNGFDLSNDEFSAITGLSVPISLDRPELEEYLIAWALGQATPDELESAADYIAYYYKRTALKRHVDYCIDSLSDPDRKRFSDFLRSELKPKLRQNGTDILPDCYLKANAWKWLHDDKYAGYILDLLEVPE